MDHLGSIDTDSAQLARIAVEVGGQTRIPSCPDWTMLELVQHLGEVHEFWAHVIEAADPEAAWEGERASPPGTLDDAVVWMRSQTRRMLEVMSAHDPSSACWTWWGEPRTSGAVRRHQVQEAALHRWDAEGSTGSVPAISREVALDGIPEWIEVRLPWMTSLPRPIVVFHTTDAPGSWILPSHDPQCDVRVSVTGSASDLVLFLNGRQTLESLTVTGDALLLAPLVSEMAALNS